MDYMNYLYYLNYLTVLTWALPYEQRRPCFVRSRSPRDPRSPAHRIVPAELRSRLIISYLLKIVSSCLLTEGFITSQRPKKGY